MKPFAFILYYGIFGLMWNTFFIPPKELELQTLTYGVKKRKKLKLVK